MNTYSIKIGMYELAVAVIALGLMAGLFLKSAF
jgi:hypothetical protein